MLGEPAGGATRLQDVQAPDTAAPLTREGSWIEVFQVWLGAGWQSFGGGTATLALVRRAVVDDRRWTTADDFTRDWALCQVAPGINLLALAILEGRRVAGRRGVAAALAGLLLPSVSLTILATALFAGVHRLEMVRAALRGVIPATVGIGIWTSIRMAAPVVASSRREGRLGLVVATVALIGSPLAYVALHPPVIVVLIGGAALVAAAAQFRSIRAHRRGSS